MLEVDKLEVSYGPVRALQGISFSVASGEIVSLVGANGAGKTSTMLALIGAVRTRAGSVRFDGRDISRKTSHQIMSTGIAHVPEGRMLFGTLTVAENLCLGAYGGGQAKPSKQELQAVLASFPMLGERLEQQASSLSGGQAQMLALARGLMAKPKLLLLDEPTLGLAPRAVEDVLALVRTLPERGITVLLVEQNVHQALQASDRAYVLENGRIMMQGNAQRLLEDPALSNAYLGLAAP